MADDGMRSGAVRGRLSPEEKLRLDEDLREAAEAKEASRVLFLLAMGADPRAADSHSGSTALHGAAQAGDAASLRALLPLGDPLALDSQGHSPLMRAVKADSSECALLLAPVSDLGQLSGWGESALDMALDLSDLRIALALLACAEPGHVAGAAPTPESPEGRRSALWRLANSGHREHRRHGLPETVARLVELAGVDAAGNAGETGLLAACLAGDMRMARMLLDMGADPSRPYEGLTPLMWACSHGNLEAVQLLLPRCDPTAMGASGEQAAGLALAGGHARCAAALLPYARLEQADAKGFTPLMHAARGGCRECVQMALPGSDPWASVEGPHGLPMTALELDALGEGSSLDLLADAMRAASPGHARLAAILARAQGLASQRPHARASCATLNPRLASLVDAQAISISAPAMAPGPRSRKGL